MTPCESTQQINSAYFRYLGGLEELLVKRYREGPVVYRFRESPGIKDAIETMGIPHTEVDIILVNDHSESFSYQLKDKDQVSVYPVSANLPDENFIHLSPQYLPPYSFILDVHLGSLARRLRLLGFDTLYRNDLDDNEIMDISLQTRRIILTRDLGILKHNLVTYGYLVRSDQLARQINEVLDRFKLRDHIKLFSRCMACNGIMTSVEKEEVWDRLEPKTRHYYHEFHCCIDCERIYWRGSHYENIELWLNNILSPQSS